MEIKVVQTTMKDDGMSGFKTSIFEGIDISREFIYYKDKSQFMNTYLERTKGCEFGYILGIPDEMWNDKDCAKCQDQCFVLIYYIGTHDGKLNYIVTKDSSVYITNEGRTIDSFNC